MNIFSSLLGRIRQFFGFLRRKLKWVIALLVLLLVGSAVFAATRPKQVVYVTSPAERGDLRQTVEAVGTVISEKDLALQFPTIDVVSQVYVKEGDTVRAGQRLAALRSGSLSAGVAGASANVQSAQAQLNQLLEGSRPEDIVIAEAQVANKRAALDNAKQTLKSATDNLVIAQSQLKTIKNEATVGLAGYVSTAGSTISQQLATAKTALVSTQGVYNANDVQDSVVNGKPSGYDSMQFNLSATLTQINQLQSAPSPTDYTNALRGLENARTVVASAASIVSQAYDIMSTLPLTSYFTNTSRETNKTTLATQKSNAQAALSALDAATKALRDASAGYDTRIAAQQSTITSLQGTRDRASTDIGAYETSLAIDQAQLDLKRAPARQTDIDAARARVRQAQADLARAASQFNDTILTAPVAGLVTKVNVKAGEMRPSSDPSVTMLGNSPYRIEMFISEVDIPKVTLSQSGSIRLDAFPTVDFKLKVSAIDSASSDKDGVPKYRVKLDFVYPHDELKVGMTGDAAITTGSRSNVVSVPLRSVIENDNEIKIVRILNADGQSFTERTVTTGMEGEAGNVEVTNVEEGEVVVVLIKQ